MKILFAVLIFCGCEYEGDDMANHTLIVDNIEFKVAKPGCHVTMSSLQTLTSGVNETIEFDTEIYDHGDCWNTSTYRYTVKVPGVYSVISSAYIAALADKTPFGFYIGINGVVKVQLIKFAAATNDGMIVLPFIYSLDVDDYIEFGIQFTTAGTKTLDNTASKTYAMIQLIEM